MEGFDDLCVATDDQRIYDLAWLKGWILVLTQPDHPSGTDRLSEVAKLRAGPAEISSGMFKGDEPLLPGGFNQASRLQL